jgi:hypothetical protein
MRDPLDIDECDTLDHQLTGYDPDSNESACGCGAVVVPGDLVDYEDPR